MVETSHHSMSPSGPHNEHPMFRDSQRFDQDTLQKFARAETPSEIESTLRDLFDDIQSSGGTIVDFFIDEEATPSTAISLQVNYASEDFHLNHIVDINVYIGSREFVIGAVQRRKSDHIDKGRQFKCPRVRPLTNLGDYVGTIIYKKPKI